jgi:HD-GYP domain-containing protein (c-di-GMP phosphodiesterase class II)
MGYGRQGDQELLERVGHLEEKLAVDGESAQLLYELGKVSFELRDASTAIRHLERALALDPNSTQIKLAYADANIKKDEFEMIQLKGKLRRVTVYEVTGIKDRWEEATVIPPDIAQKYSEAQAHIEIPEDLVLAVEALDGSVGHSRLTALLSYAIADRLRLNEDLKKTILQAGYLQDIGKEAVPHHILNRGGSLSEQESKLLEKYVVESVAACKRMGYVDPRLIETVAHHHEAWNGMGFPDGLSGEAIPIGARITAVAEAYSGLTSWRPYHDAWDARVALSEIRKAAEKGKYDPKVVETLFDILRPPS